MPSIATTPDGVVSIPLVRLPTPAGRAALGTAAAPQGSELSQLIKQASAEAQRALLNIQGSDVPAVPTPDIWTQIVQEATSIRTDVSNASKLEQSLPVVIFVIGLVVGRPLIGFLGALGFYIYTKRGATLASPPA